MELLAYTIISILANACFLYLLHFSIQEGQLLDNLLSWKKTVFEWDKKGYSFLVKAIGGECEMCFCNIYTQFLFIPYLFIGIYGVGIDLKWWVWVAVYLCYSVISTNVSLNYIKYMHKG